MTIHAGTALSNPRGNDAHQRAAQRFVAWPTVVDSDEENIACCLAGPAGFVTLTKWLWEESIMRAIRVAVSAAGIAAMVAVVASGQVALVRADRGLRTEGGDDRM